MWAILALFLMVQGGGWAVIERFCLKILLFYFCTIACVVQAGGRVLALR